MTPAQIRREASTMLWAGVGWLAGVLLMATVIIPAGIRSGAVDADIWKPERGATKTTPTGTTTEARP